jgi:hypothetical protein
MQVDARLFHRRGIFFELFFCGRSKFFVEPDFCSGVHTSMRIPFEVSKMMRGDLHYGALRRLRASVPFAQNLCPPAD